MITVPGTDLKVVFTDERWGVIYPDGTEDTITNPPSGHDVAVTLGVIGGAIALPVIAGGGIGIAMAGSAFGIGVETLAIGGAIAGGVASHNLTKDAPYEEIASEDEYSDNEADLAYLRNGDF